MNITSLRAADLAIAAGGFSRTHEGGPHTRTPIFFEGGEDEHARMSTRENLVPVIEQQSRG